MTDTIEHDIAATPEEAYLRYRSAFDNGLLIQKDWHRVDDGRHLACALGVIGENVMSPKDCPAQIMPRWVAQMVPWLFDSQTFDDATAWGLKFYAEISRLKGNVPFSVVYEWRANHCMKLAIAAAKKKEGDPAPHLELQALFRRAMAGDRAARDEWKSALKKSYDYDYVDADAYAYAYACADADAYAYAYAYAYAHADAHAYAYAYAYKMRKYEAMKLLADGFIECLKAVPSPE